MFDEFAFRDYVRRHGVKLKDVAQVMGITPVTLHRKMVGQSDFTVGEVNRCCEFFSDPNATTLFFAPEVTQTKQFR